MCSVMCVCALLHTAGHACRVLISSAHARVASMALSLLLAPQRAAPPLCAHRIGSNQPHIRQHKLPCPAALTPAWSIRHVVHSTHTHVAVRLHTREAGCPPLTRSDHSRVAQRAKQRRRRAAHIDRAARCRPARALRPRRLRTSAPLCLCTSAPLHSALLHLRTSAPLAPLRLRVAAPLPRCTPAPPHLCRSRARGS